MNQVNWRNKKIFYKVQGTGQAVMLVHGFAENGKVWDHQVSELSKHFKIIVPDLPGCGSSEFVTEDLSITDYAEALMKVAQAEINTERETFTMIGHSMGGYIALAFADKYADVLNGLGLFHSTSFADAGEKKETRKKAINLISANGKSDYLKTSIPNLFSTQSRNHFSEMTDTLIELGEETDKEALIGYQRAMMNRQDMRKVLQRMEIPILFVQGFHDTAVPLTEGLKQVHMPAICHFHLLQDSAHMGMWEEKEKSAKILFKYLEALNKSDNNL